MSARKPQLHLSQLARQDFRDILNYTQQTWGDRQFIIYRNIIASALLSISDSPKKGKKREDGVRIVTAGHHRIFYRITEDDIYVVRILHERMDVDRHLEE